MSLANQELREKLDDKLSHLSSMLTMIHGCGYESFNQWNDKIKDDYLWSCSTIAAEARELLSQIPD